MYLSIETIDSNSETLMWFIYEYDSISNGIILSSLQDSTRYYLVAKSTDLAGNLEDPLNTTEIFNSDGEYDQIYNLKYLPLEKIDNFIDNQAPTHLIITDYYVNFLIHYGVVFSGLITFVSVIFFTSRMSEQNEIIALYNNKVSPLRILVPYIISASCIFLPNIYFQNTFLPKKHLFTYMSSLKHCAMSFNAMT